VILTLEILVSIANILICAKMQNGGAGMTKHEAIVVSAYTGFLMCDFGDVHEYVEKKLGRPIWTHEFADKSIWEEIREKIKPDFLKICEEVQE
jgi:hypothetical protein